MCFLSNKMPEKLWAAVGLPQSPLRSLQRSQSPWLVERGLAAHPLLSRLQEPLPLPDRPSEPRVSAETTPTTFLTNQTH